MMGWLCRTFGHKWLVVEARTRSSVTRGKITIEHRCCGRCGREKLFSTKHKRRSTS